MTAMASKGSSKTTRPTSSSNPYVSHEEQASKYMKDHRITELFENLMAGLVYERPADPKEYMKKHIQQLLKAKSDPDEFEPPCLLDESNLKSVYYMLDITKKGHISKEQYLQAMNAIGARKFNENPPGAHINKITLETFLRETKASLRDASATYNDL
jgi:hypothetical protein